LTIFESSGKFNIIKLLKILIFGVGYDKKALIFELLQRTAFGESREEQF
jgi:hypothetical protein